MRRLIFILLVFAIFARCGQAQAGMTMAELDEILRQRAAAEKAVSVTVGGNSNTEAHAQTEEAPSEPEPPKEIAPLMPQIYYTALDLISSNDLRSSVRYESERYFAQGRSDKAASVIGRAIGAENDFSLFRLGRFCLETLPGAGDIDAQAEFLTGFMRGYSHSGILMFTTGGLKKFLAYPMTRGMPWRTVPDGASSASKDERIYIGNGAAFIPFAYGTKFKLDVTAAKTGPDVTLWKILPEGANVKSWPAGDWEKEITVRGDIKY